MRRTATRRRTGDQFDARNDRGRCEACHGVDAFAPASKFDHTRDATFSTRGAHEHVPCNQCHPTDKKGRTPKALIYRPVSGKCESCHGKESKMRGLILLGLALLVVAPLQAQERTRSPHGDLKMECKTCHSANGWTPVRVAKTFDHSTLGFALAGAHGTAACRACHQALDFKGVKSDCVSCHADRHRGELGPSCARCHTSRSFLDREVMTKAHQLTRFPLEGGHLGVDCSSCHKPGGQGSLQFVGTPTECVSCHKANFDTAPNHLASNFPTACEGCHSQVAWDRVAGLGGLHPSTPIALTGVHANRQCTDCHLAGQAYSAVRQTCDECHHTDYAGTTNPSHQAAAFRPPAPTATASQPAGLGRPTRITRPLRWH